MPISTNMETPESREDFERNLHLLEEKMNDDRFATDGILRVRHLPNGRVDMLSIDESTRLMANMCAMMDGRVLPQAEAIAEPDADSKRN